MVALSLRVGSLARRIWQTRKVNNDPIVMRVATTGAVLALGDVVKLAGYSVGLADSVVPDEGVVSRTVQQLAATGDRQT